MTARELALELTPHGPDRREDDPYVLCVWCSRDGGLAGVRWPCDGFEAAVKRLEEWRAS